MSGNFKKEDLRIIKTQKAFRSALIFLLQHRKFKQLTVNDLCEEALTSRAAFYTHYKDKYDLLESCFNHLVDELRGSGIVNMVDRIIYNNDKVMQNILEDADQETVGIVHNFVSLLLDSYERIPNCRKSEPEYKVLSGFYVGGLIEMIKWQSKHKYSHEFQSTQNYLIELMKTIFEFHIKYNKGE